VTLRSAQGALTVLPLLSPEAGVYLLPTRGVDGWLVTNPRAHVQLAWTYDAASAGRLLPLVRMLKGWNRAAGRPLRAFHLEALIWAMIGRLPPTTSGAAIWAAISPPRSVPTFRAA
jgi:hypothetical protein